MINRAREITAMMGYNSIDETLYAVGTGELILVKVPQSTRLAFTNWLRAQSSELTNADLASVISDIASSIDMAAELDRFPEDTDVCEMDLPNGWPSYCDKGLME